MGVGGRSEGAAKDRQGPAYGTLGQPFRILTVCIGNVCRSPVAERLLALRFEEAGLSTEYTVSSAGIGAMVGYPIHPQAAAQLTALGGSPEWFSARQLAPLDVQRAHLVLTATTRIRQTVVEEFPAALRRTFTLREFALLTEHLTADSPVALVSAASRRRGTVAGADLDVPDPMNRSDAVHASSARVAGAAVDMIAAALQRVSETADAR